jgi:hypothetical protein
LKHRTLRAQLRDELSRRLVPRILEAGFDGPSAISGNAILHVYRRVRGSNHEAILVQLERSGLPRFILNIETAPHAPDQLPELGGTIRGARIKPRPGAFTRSWFRGDPTVVQRVLRSKDRNSPVTAVDECLRMWPQIEAWWDNPSGSTSMDSTVLTYPGKHAHPRVA